MELIHKTCSIKWKKCTNGRNRADEDSKVLATALAEVANMSLDHNQNVANGMREWIDGVQQQIRSTLIMVVEDARNEFTKQKAVAEQQAAHTGTIWGMIESLSKAGM